MWRPLRCTKPPERGARNLRNTPPIRERRQYGTYVLSYVLRSEFHFCHAYQLRTAGIWPLGVANGTDDEHWSPKSKRSEAGTLHTNLPEVQDRQGEPMPTQGTYLRARPHVADGPPYVTHNPGLTTSHTNAQRFPETPTTKRRACFT